MESRERRVWRSARRCPITGFINRFLRKPRKAPTYPTVCENCGAPIAPKRGRRLCDACPHPTFTVQDKALSENDIQKAQVAMLEVEFPQVWFCMIPNGAYLSGIVCQALGKQRGRVVMAKVAGFLRAMGQRAGAEDMIILCPSGRLLLNEVKRTDGTVDDEQVRVHARHRELGFTVIVTRSVDDLRGKLRTFIANGGKDA